MIRGSLGLIGEVIGGAVYLFNAVLMIALVI